MKEEDVSPEIIRVRSFNRFYTQQMGVVNMLGSGLSMATARVLFEIEQRGAVAAVDLTRELEIDAGYLSRIVHGLEQRGLIHKRQSAEDGRRYNLELTGSGRRVYDELTERTHTRINALLEPIAPEDRSCLIEAMATIERILDRQRPPEPCQVHEHGPADLSWVVYRHGVLYHQACGFNERFEGLVAEVVARFAAGHDPERERLWIAEQEGEKVGSVMLTRESDEVARLRLFLVEPRSRGQGVGSQLLETFLGFARRRGYEHVVLTTVEALSAARSLYERAGFRLVGTRSHADWGPKVVEEDWELELG